MGVVAAVIVYVEKAKPKANVRFRYWYGPVTSAIGNLDIEVHNGTDRILTVWDVKIDGVDAIFGPSGKTLPEADDLEVLPSATRAFTIEEVEVSSTKRIQVYVVPWTSSEAVAASEEFPWLPESLRKWRSRTYTRPSKKYLFEVPIPPP